VYKLLSGLKAMAIRTVENKREIKQQLTKRGMPLGSR